MALESRWDNNSTSSHHSYSDWDDKKSCHGHAPPPCHHSKWLHSNLQELEEKVKAMMRMIEEEGDSFTQRAEMFYQKRPELLHLLEQFFHAYRSLAHRYGHLEQRRSLPPHPHDDCISSPLSPMHQCPISPPPFPSMHQFDSLLKDNPNNPQRDCCQENIRDDLIKSPLADRIGTYELRKSKHQVRKCRLDSAYSALQENKRSPLTSSALENQQFDTIGDDDQALALKSQMGKREVALPRTEAREDGVSRALLKLGRVEIMQRRLKVLEEEVKTQKLEILEREEQKREAIRQLSFSLNMAKEKTQRLEATLQSLMLKGQYYHHQASLVTTTTTTTTTTTNIVQEEIAPFPKAMHHIARRSSSWFFSSCHLPFNLGNLMTSPPSTLNKELTCLVA